MLTLWDWHKGRRLPDDLRKQPAWLALLAHVIAAVVWTTPWDNYLVATGVWYYDPRLVTGITLGWVPIEEYTFFVVQTLITGLWLLWLGRRLRTVSLPIPLRPRSGEMRRLARSASGWRASCRGWQAGRRARTSGSRSAGLDCRSSCNWRWGLTSCGTADVWSRRAAAAVAVSVDRRFPGDRLRHVND